MVIQTTCVANQKFESKTARIISMVSPLGLSEESKLRLWAITRLPNPIRDPMAEAIPSRMYFSVAKQSKTEAHPMKRADEYKLVTGGRPSIHILAASPKVWHMNTMNVR